ncbi:hypothetical protein EH230_11915 [Flavobacterium columnare]|uniref:Uncharacterized protein n=1 Tax=Flavobacterium columnare TaxID=996 RepID=A0A437UDA2_9FLAO|nr:hypothetical protein [Flavobacterium columnare]RVU91549.1 hypothetical protein EH230_11915 [Flavobacterium columnare]
MISQIKKATKELDDLISNDDFNLFKEKENHYNLLFENANISFFNTCSICNEINSYKSFCSCDVNFNYGLGVEKTKRIELKKYMDIFQSIDKNSSLCKFKTGISAMKGLTDEEKYILSQGPLFEQHSSNEKEDDEDVFPLIIDIEPKPKKEEFEFSINEEGFKLLDKVFINNSDNEKTLSTNSEPLKTEEFQFYRDVFLPFGTYIAIMQFPILVFADRYIKKLSSREYDVFAIVMFIFCLGLFGRLLIKSDLKEHKIKFFNSLYSEKSQLIHFIASIVLVALAVYEIALFMLLIFGIIWLISNFKDVKSKYYKSQFNRVLNSIWNKIVDILGY